MNTTKTKITLAVTWNPRGELPRFERTLPALEQSYGAIVISLPPFADSTIQDSLEAIGRSSSLDFLVRINPDWEWGRYSALQAALESSADWLHYADLDRLLRWIEILPQEWKKVLIDICRYDYLVIGRTHAAYLTHPQALVQTEWISNRVVSYLVGRVMDVSAGSKGFSRNAAQYIVDHTQPSAPLGTDAEWTVLLHLAGFNISYIEVDGLDWETADRFLDEPASSEHQQQTAILYDSDPANWAYRVRVAHEIVEAGLQAASRSLEL